MPCATFGGVLSYLSSCILLAVLSVYPWCNGRRSQWLRRKGKSQSPGKWTTTSLQTIIKQAYSCQNTWPGQFSIFLALRKKFVVILSILATAWEKMDCLAFATTWKPRWGSTLTLSMLQWNLQNSWNPKVKSCWWQVLWGILWKWSHLPTATTTLGKSLVTGCFRWGKSCRWGWRKGPSWPPNLSCL